MSDDVSIRLQVTIGGMSAHGSGPVRVLGEYDLGANLLLIEQSKQLRPGDEERRVKGCATMSDNAHSEHRDLLFKEDHLSEAIRCFFDMDGRGLLRYEAGMEALNPKSRIQVKSIEEKGRKYELAPDISNGQVAVIAMAWFALRQSGMAQMMDAADDMEDLFEIQSVGLTASPGRVRFGSDGWPQ